MSVIAVSSGVTGFIIGLTFGISKSNDRVKKLLHHISEIYVITNIKDYSKLKDL